MHALDLRPELGAGAAARLPSGPVLPVRPGVAGAAPGRGRAETVHHVVQEEREWEAGLEGPPQAVRGDLHLPAPEDVLARALRALGVGEGPAVEVQPQGPDLRLVEEAEAVVPVGVAEEDGEGGGHRVQDLAVQRGLEGALVRQVLAPLLGGAHHVEARVAPGDDRPDRALDDRDELRVPPQGAEEERDLPFYVLVRPPRPAAVGEPREGLAERSEQHLPHVQPPDHVRHPQAVGVEEHRPDVREAGVGGRGDVVDERELPPLVHVDEELPVAPREVDEDDDVDAHRLLLLHLLALLLLASLLPRLRLLRRRSFPLLLLSLGLLRLHTRDKLSFRLNFSLSFSLFSFACSCLLSLRRFPLLTLFRLHLLLFLSLLPTLLLLLRFHRFLLLLLLRLLPLPLRPRPGDELGPELLEDVPRVLDPPHRPGLGVALEQEHAPVRALAEEAADGGPEVPLAREFVEVQGRDGLPLRLRPHELPGVRAEGGEGQQLDLRADWFCGEGLSALSVHRLRLLLVQLLRIAASGPLRRRCRLLLLVVPGLLGPSVDHARRERDQVRVRLVGEVHLADVDVEGRLDRLAALLEVHHAAHALRGRRPQQPSRALLECLRRAGVAEGLGEALDEAREHVHVVPAEARPQVRPGRGRPRRPLRLLPLALLAGGKDGRERVELREQALLARGEQVPALEHLLLETVQQRRRQAVVRVDLLHHDDDPERRVDLAEPVRGSERQADVELVPKLRVVLVQEVVERLVECFAVDEHDRAPLCHAELDLLQGRHDLQVALVRGEVGAVDHLGGRVP
mmetsp:Transcript_26608/g.64391  ORF Transcript_26608/g.64391 Transcript_26608/m.64391 type:complete len:796 (-) Transcript_26608:673-3060(-)